MLFLSDHQLRLGRHVRVVSQGLDSDNAGPPRSPHRLKSSRYSPGVSPAASLAVGPGTFGFDFRRKCHPGDRFLDDLAYGLWKVNAGTFGIWESEGRILTLSLRPSASDPQPRILASDPQPRTPRLRISPSRHKGSGQPIYLGRPGPSDPTCCVPCS